MCGHPERGMTIKDYRPKDYVWFDHKQATDTRKNDRRSFFAYSRSTIGRS